MNLSATLHAALQELGLLETELAFVSLLSIAALVAILIRRIRLPYTVALVLAGLALSFFPSPLDISLSTELILSLLVPPLIFEATLLLPWERLRQDLAPILLLAVAGTLLGALVVSIIILLLGRTLIPMLDIPFTAAFAFGALIAATDPVAVIAFFRALGVSKRLAVLIEGESLFNDGIAIVVFNIALAAGTAISAGEEQAFDLLPAVVEFLRVSIGGLGVGIVLGHLVSSFILRNVDDNLIETATTVALAFGSFIVAEEFHLSGILAVVAAGLIVGNVGLKNASPTTRLTLENFWEFMAYVVNSLVFLLIGLDTDLNQFRPNLPSIGVAVAAVLLSRSLVVYPLTWIHARLDAKRRIPVAYRHVMYWGGLRGAISLALALSLTGATVGLAVAQDLKLMTFGVVLFTLLVQGTTIAPLLRRLGLSETLKQRLLQQRRQALLYATRAGKRVLDRLYDDGILSAELWRAMVDVYNEDIRQRDTDLRELLSDYPELEQEMILQARRSLLQAERSALSDTVRRGLISEEVYAELIRETDNRAAALDVIRAGMRAANVPSREQEP